MSGRITKRVRELRITLPNPSTPPAVYEQGGVPAKVAQESAKLQEPRSRSDPSELPVSNSVVPAPPVPVAPMHAQPSAPKRTTPDFVTRLLDQEELASMRRRATISSRREISLRLGSSLNEALKPATLAQH
jgi:hypothetical protein